MNYTLFCTKSIKNIRELEKQLREWILITTLTEFYTFTKLGKVQIGLLRKTNKQTRFRNKKSNMYMVTIEKSEFGQLSDKRYLTCDVISSLPYGHQDLNAITEFKDSLNLTLQDLIKYHENHLLRFEQGIIQGNARMRIINTILTQQPVFYKKVTTERSQFQIENTTRDFLLKGLWRKI